MPRRRYEPEQFQPEIRRARLELLVLYEVTESELEILAQGAPNSTYLNFGIGLLSAASSFIIALLTTTIESLKVFTVFVVVSAVGSVLGVVFLVIWYRGSRPVADLVETIRGRLPPEGIQEPPNPPPATGA